MKFLVRFSLALGLVGTGTTSALHAQASSLETRAFKENVSRLQSQLEDLMLSYTALKKEVDSLRSELRKVRAQSAQKDPVFSDNSPTSANRGLAENPVLCGRKAHRVLWT